MSRKRKNKQAAAVPDEVLAEGSGGTPVHVQSDEVGTALHVSAEDVEAVEILAEPPEASAEDASAAQDAVAPDDDVAELSADGTDDGTDELTEAEPIENVEAAGADDELAAEGELADDIAAVMPTSAASLNDHQLRHLVEALVFAADKPITVVRLRQLTRVADVRRLEQALAELAVDYQDRGVILQQVSGGYQFRTQTKFSAWVQQLIQGRPVRLSRAQLETLAIVAYRQPITRPEIDDIRGVDSSATLKLLMDRTLIRILGKREEVGRPMLYGTTKEFLDFFSLGDLRELPTLREYSELTDESRKVMKDRLGISADGGGEPDGGSSPPASDEGGGAPPGDDGASGGDEPASASSASSADGDQDVAGTEDPPPNADHVASIDSAEPAVVEAGFPTEPEEAHPELVSEEGSQDWPQGSMRMAAVTPIIDFAPEAPDGDDPAVDAHVATVLEETGVAATREPTQE